MISTSRSNAVQHVVAPASTAHNAAVNAHGHAATTTAEARVETYTDVSTPSDERARSIALPDHLGTQEHRGLTTG